MSDTDPLSGAHAEHACPFHAFLAAGDDLCALVDRDYRYLWVNQAYREGHRLQGQAVEGRQVPELLGVDYFEQTVRPRLDRCLAGAEQRYETERELARLGPRKLLVRYRPVEVPGQSARVAGKLITDIDGWRAAGAEPADRAALLDLAGRAARFGYWFADLASERIEWSDTTADIHAMPRGHAPSLDDSIAFFAPEHRERVRERFLACAENAVPYDEELAIITADGRRRWVRSLGEPVRDGHGRIVRVRGIVQDVTASRERDQELRKLAQITEQSPAPTAVTDTEGRIEYVNPAFERISGYPRQALLGDTPSRIQSGNTPDATYRDLWATISAGHVWTGELQNRRSDGSLYWESEVISPLTNDQGRITHYVAIKQDITALKETEHALRASRDELASLLESRKALINSLPAYIALLDADGEIIDINDQWRHSGGASGYAGGELGPGVNYIRLCEAAAADRADEAGGMAAGLRAVLAGQRDDFALEYPDQSPGQVRWYRVMAKRLVRGEAGDERHGAVVMHVDVTEHKLAEQERDRIAFEDPLTGLYSRNGFSWRLQQHLDQDGWLQAGLVVMVDIIGLRDINEGYGYDGGDRLLIEFGRRLREHAVEPGWAGRIGGGEFTLFLLPEAGETAETCLERLVAALSGPYELEGIAIELACRVGYTRLGEQRRSSDTILHEAERALFQHRYQSSRPWVAYSTRLQEETEQRIGLTRALRQALEADQLELHFQPKVDLATRTLVSCEALLRWNHPERGLIPPGVFIPVAEQSQLIGPLGDWALRRACEHLRDWRDAGLEPVRVAVNVSVIQFQRDDFADRVRAVLDECGVAPTELALEVTESVFGNESEALLRDLRQLRDMGVRLALDDFGTGYSSLSYLQRYPFDELKIDQSFVFHLLDDAFSHNIVETVMMLARALDADVMAEGIESAAVGDELLAMGCRFGQGFYYTMPLEAEDFQWLLERGSRLPLSAESAR